MRRTPFVEGWETRPHASFFLEMVGAAKRWHPVPLPHDATLAQPRDPAHGSGTGTVTASSEGCRPAIVTVAAR